MHRRPAVVVFTAGEDLETFFQSLEPPAVLIEFELFPRVDTSTAQVDVTEHHAAEVGQVGDAALAGGDRRIDRDGTDNPDEMLHLDREQKIKINDAFRVDQSVGKQQSVDAGRCADAGRELAGQEDDVQYRAADHRDEIIFKEKFLSPAPLQIAAEHPQRQHVEQQMKQPAMEKLVGEQLPEVKLVEHQMRHQAEIGSQREIDADVIDGLDDEHRDVGDQEKLHRRRHTTAAETHLSGLILHCIRV